MLHRLLLGYENRLVVQLQGHVGLCVDLEHTVPAIDGPHKCLGFKLSGASAHRRSWCICNHLMIVVTPVVQTAARKRCSQPNKKATTSLGFSATQGPGNLACVAPWACARCARCHRHSMTGPPCTASGVCHLISMLAAIIILGQLSGSVLHSCQKYSVSFKFNTVPLPVCRWSFFSSQP